MGDVLTVGGVDAAAGAEPGPDAPRWFYVIQGRRMGPISTIEMTQLLLRGPYDPRMLVWRQGMMAWAPVSQTPELLLPGLASLVPPPPIPMNVVTDERRRRNAKANCVGAAISLAVVFIAAILAAAAPTWPSGSRPFMSLPRVVFGVSLLPGLYLTFYLPLRFRVIQSLPAGYRVTGIICGIILIVLCWGSLLLLAA